MNYKGSQNGWGKREGERTNFNLQAYQAYLFSWQVYKMLTNVNNSHTIY